MDYSPTPGYQLSPPPPDNALVVFLRPAVIGHNISTAVYEDDKFLGIVVRHSYIEHLTTPGKHMCMLVSEAADFLGADLVGGKIY